MPLPEGALLELQEHERLAAEKVAPRLYVPVFTITLLVSAFLLFAVQPMLGKMIVPLLGGSPQVWNVAMLFFQAVLLAGYAWAHASSRYFSVRKQAALQVALLALCGLALPLALPSWTPPSTSENPIFWQLALMAVACGGPFFVLASSAPMLQRWFASTSHEHASNPYFLYAASNLGSLSALLAYPTILEPLLTVPEQTRLWSFGYVLLIALTLTAALLTTLQSGGEQARANPLAPLTRKQCLTWLTLGFLPSSLMLGVTTYITTDLASAPMIWVVPLALYVLTFVVAFARTLTVPMKPLLFVHALLLCVVASLFIDNYINVSLVVVGLHLLLFFASALLCHVRLAAARPEPSHLTAYYLVVSVGGVLGGMFNALVAPAVFVIPLEYALILGAICFLRPDSRVRPKTPLQLDRRVAAAVLVVVLSSAVFWKITAFHSIVALSAIVVLMSFKDNRWIFASAVCVLLFFRSGTSWRAVMDLKHLSRNFFGVARVTDGVTKGERVLMHGPTIHGAQIVEEPFETTPLTYYYNKGPAGDIYDTIAQPGSSSQRIGVIGLGAGTLACYSRAGRSYEFYEIDPAIVRIAEDPRLFTYLSKCGSPYKIVVGDGRLKIAEAPDRSYDMVLIDAFSSDNIPIHLMTGEAFHIYLSKLKEDGLLALHISSNFFNLAPVITAIAKQQGLGAVFRYDFGGRIGESDVRYSPSIYAAVGAEKRLLPLIETDRWRADSGKPVRAWTDDYANLIGALWIGRPKVPSK